MPPAWLHQTTAPGLFWACFAYPLKLDLLRLNDSGCELSFSFFRVGSACPLPDVETVSDAAKLFSKLSVFARLRRSAVVYHAGTIGASVLADMSIARASPRLVYCARNSWKQGQDFALEHAEYY